MNIRKIITLASVLAIITGASQAPVATAHATRELITTFGSLESGAVKGVYVGGPSGLAVDLETGNVYVTDNWTQTIYVFGPTGGRPVDGVPSEIDGVHISSAFEASGIAIDNSCYEHQPRLTGRACEEYDPSYGDIYVMDNNIERSGVRGNGERGVQKFRLNAAHEYELAGEVDLSIGVGVAVDPRGNLYVIDNANESIIEFKKTVEKIVTGGTEEFQERLEEVIIPQNIVRNPGYMAADGVGDLYVGSGQEDGGLSEGYKGVAKLRLDAAGGVVREEVLSPDMEEQALFRPVAVDPISNSVLVGNGPEIAEYDETGQLRLTFGSTEALGGSFGERNQGAVAIAVNSGSGLVYVANRLHGDIDMFGPVIAPPVIETTQPVASSVTQTSALIAGTANPESSQATCYFEYVADGEFESMATDPYEQGGRTTIESLPGGHVPATVEHIALTGLLPGTLYHYRMVVSNASGTTFGPDETLMTAAATPPLASTGSATQVSPTGATLGGVVAPRGQVTSYVFEVGTDASYDGAKLFGSAGSSTGEVSVSVTLQYLIPGTTYHYRLVATSFDGTGYGQDGTFTTPSVPAMLTQPAGLAQLAVGVGKFPSIAGAITISRGAGTHKKASSDARRHASARHGCKLRRRTSCKEKAHRTRKRVPTNQRSKGR